MKVFRIYQIVDGDLLPDELPPKRARYHPGDVVGVLSQLSASNIPSPTSGWILEVTIPEKGEIKVLRLPIEPFVAPDELARSQVEPVRFADLQAVKRATPTPDKPLGLRPDWLWLFQDALYVAEREPRPSEFGEVALMVKANHYRRLQTLKRIREEVASHEAMERAIRAPGRSPLANDVKLLVWARDGGRCVECDTNVDLQFVHIIPVDRGGSEAAENIQLICRKCMARASAPFL